MTPARATQVRPRPTSTVVALVLLLIAPAAFGKVAPAERCAAKKARASALAVNAGAFCRAKALGKGRAVDAKCLAKVDADLRARFAKAEAKVACPGDVEVAIAVAGACGTAFAHGTSGGARCTSKKVQAAGKKVLDAAACEQKPATGPACLQKVDASFATAVAKADRKGPCAGTAAELDAVIDACVASLSSPPTCSGAGFAACDGTCPVGLTCRPYEVFADGASIETGCSCVDVTHGPECSGTTCGTDRHCPDPGHVCERWTTGDPPACDHMVCQPALTTPSTLPPASENRNECDGGEFPTCAGTCANGGRCQSFEAFFRGIALFAGCLCVDPTAPRCEMPAECRIDILPFSHCADPTKTCLVQLVLGEDEKDTACSEAHCGDSPPTTTSTSVTTLTTMPSGPSTTLLDGTTTTSSSSTSSSTSTSTSLPCVSAPGVSGHFQDLGDCTVRDTSTGLEWEQKSTTPGPHHVDNRYVWAGCCGDGCQTMCQPNAEASATCLALSEAGTEGCGSRCPDDGHCFVGRAGAVTTVWDWINQLNAQRFAGHDDWRLPREAGFNPTGTRELGSIVLRPSCTRVPCIDAIFGPTTEALYWSATQNAERAVEGWFVEFGGGLFGGLLKREPGYVRAVRSGEPP